MTRIKICGIRRDEDVDFVNAAMPDYAGFVFAPSRRRVTPEEAFSLRARLAPGIVPVGVFAGADVNHAARLYLGGVIDIVQLHGGEGEEYIASLKRACGAPVIQAVMAGRGEIAGSADFVMFDSHAAGSGRAFDWRKIPSCEKPWFLAGGIRLDNIGDALALRPFAIDLSSGAETDGQKDGEKIRALVARARNGV
jgi:phosphoribosylanthranilate isomerase